MCGGDLDSPAQQLEEFLGWAAECGRIYKEAFDAVHHEDLRLQDLIHELEFAENKAERNRVATKLQKSRKLRRRNKDIVKKYELVVNFLAEQGTKATLKKMRQLLGKQRTEEAYLAGERGYKPRAGKEKAEDGEENAK